MMKYPILIIALFSFVQLSFSQSFEVGTSGGVTGYYGDLNESELRPEKVQPAFQAFARFNFTDRISVRFNYMQGSLQGTDANNINPALKERNLHFRSPLKEISLIGEFSILRFSGFKAKSFTPYLAAGIAGFQFNPQAQYQGEWHDLQPLNTEGQGTATFPNRHPYRLHQISIPFGGGVKMQLTDNLIVGIEAMWRKTFTDYLDDVSNTYGDPQELRENYGPLAAELSNRSGNDVSANTQRGTAHLKDMYQYTGITIAYRFSSGQRLNISSRNTGLYCPVKF